MTIQYEPISRSWFSDETKSGEINPEYKEHICVCFVCQNAFEQRLGNNINEVVLPQPDGKDQDSQP